MREIAIATLVLVGCRASAATVEEPSAHVPEPTFDLDAAQALPRDATAADETGPPIEARMCRSPRGSCQHRIGEIDCECSDGHRVVERDPAGARWYDDVQCSTALADACGHAPSTSIGIACADGPNACTIELSDEPMISCQCGQTGGFATTGDASLRDRDEAELVALCHEQSRSCESS